MNVVLSSPPTLATTTVPPFNSRHRSLLVGFINVGVVFIVVNIAAFIIVAAEKAFETYAT